ncbi:MAG: HypC/HybG/HupF family hydrogenase formation chaperone [Deltaproteobacteria bacterium]|jgi:hydrogenase expression/formation protein HypC
MCLGIPMEIVALQSANRAVVDLDGVQYDVNVSLIEKPLLGDFVIVHAGFAIERLDRLEAEARLEIFAEMARLYRKESFPESGA